MLFFHKIKSQTCSCDDSKLAAVTNLVCNGDTNYNTNAVRGKKGPKGDNVSFFVSTYPQFEN